MHEEPVKILFTRLNDGVRIIRTFRLEVERFSLKAITIHT